MDEPAKFGYALLNLAHAAEDREYGLLGAINNLRPLLAALGGIFTHGADTAIAFPPDLITEFAT